MTYRNDVRNEVLRLRKQGKTYQEIQLQLGIVIPKSTLSYWSHTIKLSQAYDKRITQLNINNLVKARRVAMTQNKKRRIQFFHKLDQNNRPIAKLITNAQVAKIALAMLCLGEASKYTIRRTSFTLGNSDPRIIQLFLILLKQCYSTFSIKKVRCTIQCRADQDIATLETYWQKITGVPKNLFYKARIDPRTIGKPTLKKDYKGVLRVDYLDSAPHHDLESLAELVYNQAVD